MNVTYLSVRCLAAILISLFSAPLWAQNFVQVSIGQGYGKQAFYKLSNDDTTEIAASSWDLAFTVYGLQDAGIHINETSISNFGAPAAQMELYVSAETDWSVALDSTNLGPKQWNPEATWAYGAFNTTRSPANPFDYGWGIYTPQSNQVTGNKIFLIKLLNGQWRKVQIQSLIQPNYTFRHARLNGTDEKTVTINKTAFPGQTVAYYNFALDTVLSLAPASGFDLWFGRYITPLLDPASGEILDYSVTGILQNRGVTVARQKGVDPVAATAPTSADSFKTRLDIIGHDWKYFDFVTGWGVEPDLVYFVKTSDQQLYKLVFADFEGISTGISTFEKTALGVFSSLDPAATGVTGWKVFPTLVTQELHLSLEATQQAEAQVRILTADGRTVQTYREQVQPGLQVWAIQGLEGLANGAYLIGLEIKGQRHFQRFIINR